MERIRSVEEYKELVRENKQRFPKLRKNAVLMTNAIGEAVDTGRLYQEKHETGLFLFLDETAYYKLYYFVKEGAPMPDLRRDKPVLVEELSNRGARDGEIEEIEPVLSAAGFQYMKNNLQVEIHPEEMNGLSAAASARQAALRSSGITMAFCDDRHMAEITALWKEYLDMTDIPGDHLHLQENDKVLCAFNEEGRIVCTQWWRNSGRSSEGRHTVTHPDYYRRGLASALLLAWCADALKEGIGRCTTWITDTNYRSLALYHKLGFTENGRTSKQYILPAAAEAAATDFPKGKP